MSCSQKAFIVAPCSNHCTAVTVLYHLCAKKGLI